MYINGILRCDIPGIVQEYLERISTVNGSVLSLSVVFSRCTWPKCSNDRFETSTETTLMVVDLLHALLPKPAILWPARNTPTDG